MDEAREIRNRLIAECERQLRSTNADHELGKQIATGINAARIAIDSIPFDCAPEDYVLRALAVLEGVRHDVDDPDDEDGWTLGGVGTIARAVLDERRKLERAGATTREGILAVVDDALRALPDRAEVLRRQVAILLLDRLPDVEPTRGTCSWCRRDGPAHRFDGMRQVCRECTRLFAANLADASDGKQIPAPGMVIADVTRALRAANEPAAERIVAELERRATARRSRQPRGFLPSCDGCSLAFERCRWTATLPGVDLCDGCIRDARDATRS